MRRSILKVVELEFLKNRDVGIVLWHRKLDFGPVLKSACSENKQKFNEFKINSYISVIASKLIIEL